MANHRDQVGILLLCLMTTLVHAKERCGAKADIVFILDSSTSEGSSNFEKQIEFVKNFVRNFEIGDNSTLFSVVSFSSSVHNDFWLKDHKTEASLLSALSGIRYMTGNTYTDLALSFVRQNSFKVSNGGRSDAENIVVILTDGESTSPLSTLNEANLLHDLGIEVLSVGVGSRITQLELNNIASDLQHVFRVSTFDALKSIQSELQNSVCNITSTAAVTTVEAKVCGGTKADIVFLLDSSTSEGKENFRTELNFVKNITSAFQISQNDVQIGIVTFSTSPTLQFHLDTYGDNSDVMNAIDNIQYTPGNTYTHLGLNMVKDNIFTTSHGMRNDVPHILVVMTDGQSQYGLDTQAAAKEVHQAGIMVNAIGIGNDVDNLELTAIASDPQHVFAVKDFNALSTIQKEVLNTTCIEPSISTIKPTEPPQSTSRPIEPLISTIKPTEPPQSTSRPKCGDAPADIVFILDSSGSETLVNFQKQLNFVGDFVRQFQIGPHNIQIGLVTFSYEARNEFYFNTYHDQQSIIQKLTNISYIGSTTRTDLGLSYARLYHFMSLIHGARPNAQKIAIILTDGQSKYRADTLTEASKLKQIGVKVISIGIGKSINADELNAMATDKQHVFTVANFDILQSIKTELTSVACDKNTCDAKMVDVIFLLDSSDKEDVDHFHKQLDFVKTFVSQFTIGRYDVQVGVATYSDIVYEQFKLNTYYDKQALLDAISRVPYSGSTITSTHLALQYAQHEGFRPQSGGRTNANHVVVLLSMGPSTNQTATIAEGHNLINDPDIDQVITIGVGRNADETESLATSSSTSNMIHAPSFFYLDSVLSNLTNAVCKQCAAENKADIVFALDTSASEGPTNFQKQLDFLSNFVNDFPVAPDKVQFGLVTFSTAAQVEFELNQYSDKQSLMAAVQRVPYRNGNTHTYDALKIIRTHSFLPTSGARADVKHFVIVLTDGASTNAGLTAIEASKLKATNVTVLAIGIGSLNYPELHTIATDNHYVFNVTGFDALQSIKGAVQKVTC